MFGHDARSRQNDVNTIYFSSTSVGGEVLWTHNWPIYTQQMEWISKRALSSTVINSFSISIYLCLAAVT